MRKLLVCLMAVTVFAVPAFATHLVDSIRVTVSAGSHTINTTTFPNGVWFQLPGGVRESSKTTPPFPTVSPGGTITVTFNLLSNPDSVIGANFDMRMDGVAHGGQNLFTGASWLSHLNQFGDLVGHPPDDATIKYELVLQADPPPPLVPSLGFYGLAILAVLLTGAAVFYFRKRKVLTA